MMLTHESAPESMPTPPEWKKKIMHARISIDGEVIMGSDPPPGHFHQPQGFSGSLLLEHLPEAERKLNTLSECGSVHIAFAKTFFAMDCRLCVDPYDIRRKALCP